MYHLLVQKIKKTLLRKDAAEARKHVQSCEKEGLDLTAVSGYRSYKRQNRCMIHTLDVKEKPKLIR